MCQNLICIDYPPPGQEVSQAGMDDICLQTVIISTWFSSCNLILSQASTTTKCIQSNILCPILTKSVSPGELKPRMQHTSVWSHCRDGSRKQLAAGIYFSVALTVEHGLRRLSWHWLRGRTWGLRLLRARARLMESQVDFLICQAWGSRGNEISLAPLPTLCTHN